ncbi:ribonuclease HI family protein [Arthrobacter sp. FW306-2-2C-D06B]|uniref:ribonuclease HI family protein n=1 Tax=Arthrobacter sp. FW306-2-2C-D06B TaxID=2879618 RepID=UPI001F19BBAA|nr:ribonuclease HI family protein [Arthrobacter sp. FW306-2-2C-D06B]UKA59599.1 ribonuclease HI family protein [Arthrobacter sp. FW306-2-2C-D06B]
MTIIAAADGSALGNPGPAGWAWYVNDSCWRAGGWPHGTNNQGELMAVLDLFRSTAHVPDEELKILCDSQYVINCITKWMPGWKRKGWRKADGKPVLNVDLLKDIDQAIVGRKYTFEWVKGHAGHDLNEAADDRARAVATAFQQGIAAPSGPGYPGAAEAARSFAHAPAARTPSVRTAPVEAPSLFDDDHDDAPDEDLTLFGGQDLLSGRSLPNSPAAFAEEGAFIEPTLFAGDDEDVVLGQAAGRSDAETVILLEKELLRPDVRGDLGRTGILLHPDFTEIGSSGRVWSRDELMMALEGDPGETAEVEIISAERISGNAMLLHYRSYGRTGSALRSSIWLLDDGRWRLRFHQSTPEK